MTLQQGIKTNWADAVDSIVSEIEQMPNYTTVSENWTFDTNTEEHEFTDKQYKIFELDTGEFFEIEYTDGPGLKVAFGDSWDTDSVNPYPNSPPSNDFHFNDDDGFAPADSSFSMPPDTTVVYDLSVIGTDWAVYVERQENDSIDEEMFMGLEKIEKLWDYSNASNVEAEYVFGYKGNCGGSEAKDYRHTHYLMNGGVDDDSKTLFAVGRPNPDSNFSDYPAVSETVLVSELYNETVIGKHNMWFTDLAGSHGDTVSDSDTGNEYLIRNAFNTDRGICMRTN